MLATADSALLAQQAEDASERLAVLHESMKPSTDDECEAYRAIINGVCVIRTQAERIADLEAQVAAFEADCEAELTEADLTDTWAPIDMLDELDCFEMGINGMPDHDDADTESEAA